MRVIASLLPGVELLRGDHSEYGQSFYLRLLNVVIAVTEKQSHFMLVQTLPEAKLVWSVNTESGQAFFSDDYPSWSVKPHPGFLVAGNIYYATKGEAEIALNRAIHRKKEALAQAYDDAIASLDARISPANGEKS